jgi:hypothetical protein
MGNSNAKLWDEDYFSNMPNHDKETPYVGDTTSNSKRHSFLSKKKDQAAIMRSRRDLNCLEDQPVYNKITSEDDSVSANINQALAKLKVVETNRHGDEDLADKEYAETHTPVNMDIDELNHILNSSGEDQDSQTKNN